jgi:hypothetical protein
MPEDKNAVSLREQIADEGVVGGIARRIRGAADDYVHEKLDEIEQRIDRKLDEIDRRMGRMARSGNRQSVEDHQDHPGGIGDCCLA